jgi:hypothetical protein
MIWQFTLGLIGITLVESWISAPSAAFILIHALLELTYFALTLLLITDRVSQIGLKRVKWSLIGISSAFILAFMISGDIYYKVALGGIALFTDVANFIVSLINIHRSWKD